MEEDVVKELAEKYNKSYGLINVMCAIIDKELGKIDTNLMEEYFFKCNKLE